MSLRRIEITKSDQCGNEFFTGIFFGNIFHESISPTLISINAVCFKSDYNDHLEILVFLVLKIVTTVSSWFYIKLMFEIYVGIILAGSYWWPIIGLQI